MELSNDVIVPKTDTFSCSLRNKYICTDGMNITDNYSRRKIMYDFYMLLVLGRS